MNTRSGQLDLLKMTLSHLAADGSEVARLTHAFPSVWGLTQEDPLGLEGDEWDELTRWVEHVQSENEDHNALADGPGEMAAAYFDALSPRRLASEREQLLEAIVALLLHMGSLG